MVTIVIHPFGISGSAFPGFGDRPRLPAPLISDSWVTPAREVASAARASAHRALVPVDLSEHERSQTGGGIRHRLSGSARRDKLADCHGEPDIVIPRRVDPVGAGVVTPETGPAPAAPFHTRGEPSASAATSNRSSRGRRRPKGVTAPGGGSRSGTRVDSEPRLSHPSARHISSQYMIGRRYDSPSNGTVRRQVGVGDRAVKSSHSLHASAGQGRFERSRRPRSASFANAREHGRQTTG